MSISAYRTRDSVKKERQSAKRPDTAGGVFTERWMSGSPGGFFSSGGAAPGTDTYVNSQPRLHSLSFELREALTRGRAVSSYVGGRDVLLAFLEILPRVIRNFFLLFLFLGSASPRASSRSSRSSATPCCARTFLFSVCARRCLCSPPFGLRRSSASSATALTSFRCSSSFPGRLLLETRQRRVESCQPSLSNYSLCHARSRADFAYHRLVGSAGNRQKKSNSPTQRAKWHPCQGHGALPSSAPH